MGSNQLYKGSLATIILKLLEEKGSMYDYQITQFGTVPLYLFQVVQHPLPQSFGIRGYIADYIDLLGQFNWQPQPFINKA